MTMMIGYVEYVYQWVCVLDIHIFCTKVFVNTHDIGTGKTE